MFCARPQGAKAAARGRSESAVRQRAGGAALRLFRGHDCPHASRQNVFKASYTSHYRSGLIGALEFRSTSTAHAPVLQALELIKRYKAETTHNTQYYARGEQVPLDGVVAPDLRELLYKTDYGVEEHRNSGLR